MLRVIPVNLFSKRILSSVTNKIAYVYAYLDSRCVDPNEDEYATAAYII